MNSGPKTDGGTIKMLPCQFYPLSAEYFDQNRQAHQKSAIFRKDELIPVLTDYRNNESGRSVCLSVEPVMDQR